MKKNIPHTKVILDFSGPQQHKTSKCPKVVLGLISKNYKESLISLGINVHARMYEGGRHCLSITLMLNDVYTWLGMLKEQHPEITSEIEAMKKELNRKIIFNEKDHNGAFNVILANIKRQHVVNGSFQSESWFWRPVEDTE